MSVDDEIVYYNALPYVYESFMDVPELSDGIIRLVCTVRNLAIPERGWVPCYDFDICRDSEKVGEIRLRIGYTDSLYYSGQIGYEVNEAHRGKGYAMRACRLIMPVARYHRMEKLLITNEDGNAASYRVCEKLGAKFVRKAELPSWHDMYEEGHRYMNVFEWSIS